MQEDQSVSEMAEEVLMRQTKALAHRSGYSLEDARQAVSDTEAGRQLRVLARGEHRHEKAHAWQASVFWDRAEERLMHLYASEAPSRFAAERHYSWLESYMERLEGKQERAHYYALVEEKVEERERLLPQASGLRWLYLESDLHNLSKYPAAILQNSTIRSDPTRQLSYNLVSRPFSNAVL